MAWVKGSPRFDWTLDRIERAGNGRYSVRQPVASSGAEAAERANEDILRGLGSESSMGKRGESVFAICSPSEKASAESPVSSTAIFRKFRTRHEQQNRDRRMTIEDDPICNDGDGSRESGQPARDCPENAIRNLSEKAVGVLEIRNRRSVCYAVYCFAIFLVQRSVHAT